MPSYIVTETTPSRRPNQPIHTGIGGAGNISRPSKAISALPSSAPIARVSTNSSGSSTSSATRFSSGRGGAGNIHPIAAAAPFSFADLETPEHDVYHVGRGGSGNWAARKGSEAGSSRKGSGSSEGSVKAGFLRRLSGALSR